MITPPLWCHHLDDLRPVFETSEHGHQADQFVTMFRRLGSSAKLGAEFRRWANGKDFWPQDRRAIAGEVRELLAQRGRP
jgi:hypothetical protein